MWRANWFSRIVLQCTFLVVIARPEEVFNTTPPPVKSNFSCFGRSTGFYADFDANCRVYHTCDDYGNKFSYRCPEETAFRQDALICDHAHLVKCKAPTDMIEKENTDRRENVNSGLPPFLRLDSLEPPNNRRSYSRSFQVIQRPNKSASNKVQPGFVFSASVFLRDLDQSETAKKATNPNKEEAKPTEAKPTIGLDKCNVHRGRMHLKNDVETASSTIRAPFQRVSFKASTFDNRLASSQTQKTPTAERRERNGARRNNGVLGFQERAFGDKKSTESRRTDPGSPAANQREMKSDSSTEYARRESFTASSTYQSVKPTSRDFLRLSFANNRDYPYLETLRSIQANARVTTSRALATTVPKSSSTTTEIPVHALTLSLKPLVPNELEYDPYYPNLPTTTEAYYTPPDGSEEKSPFRTTTQPPRSSVRFEIPAVLPDLNTLEDLVDRRKLFYIPRVTLV